MKIVSVALWILIAARGNAQSVNQCRELCDAFISPDGPGIAVVVVDHGRPAFTYHRGFADLAARKPIAEKTRFDPGSIIKQFTAALVLRLAEQGKCRLDDPVIRYLPELPPTFASVTIRHLMNHTAGLPRDIVMSRSSAGPDEMERDALPYRDRPEFFRRWHASGEPKLPPGEAVLYSSLGYVLLGLAAERMTGSSYADSLQALILDPAGMSGAVIRRPGVAVPAKAVGYARGGGASTEWVPDDPDPTLYPVRNLGAMVVTLDDLIAWARVMQARSLLDAASWATMFSAPDLPGHPFPGYGAGWYVGRVGGRAVAWHNGDSGCFHAAIRHYPDEQVAVIVLGNFSPASPFDLAQNLGSAWLRSPRTGTINR